MMAKSMAKSASSKDAGPRVQVEEVDPQFTPESVKVVADIMGVDKVPDDVLHFLSENVTLHLKETVQEAAKFCRNAKRKCLTSADIDHSLKVQNIEPLYGFVNRDTVPFRFASGGGREIYFQEDPEIDLEEILSRPLPKVWMDTSLRAHWLAIDGIQPAIPENPPPVEKDKQLIELVEPPSKDKHTDQVEMDLLMNADGIPNKDKEGKLKTAEKRKLESDAKKLKGELGKNEYQYHAESAAKYKGLMTHELSVEQQLYYREITEACVSSNEARRTEALQSLCSDPGLYQLLPRFAMFISEGVKMNVAQHNLALLIYLLRMIKALMENPNLYLEKYLHDMIPSITTCIVSKQLCPRPEVDNHWALRDFAARLMAQVCKSFNSPTNNVQARITKLLCKALYNEKAPLATHYGALAGLAELGIEVLKILVLPRLRIEGQLIKLAKEGNSQVEKVSSEHLQTIILKHFALVILRVRHPPDVPEQYQMDYGYLGPLLCNRVAQVRQGLTNVRTPTTPTTPTNVALGVAHPQHIIGS